MKLLLSFLLILLTSCPKQKKATPFTTINIQNIYEGNISIRAIEIVGDSLAFAANRGNYGFVDIKSDVVRIDSIQYDSLQPAFRSIATNGVDLFMMSIASPALLYKTNDHVNYEIVYQEEGEKVFYDAMKFWNQQEGIAIGDAVDGCLSIIITRDGGKTWAKTKCNQLPPATKDEGAFAASNTNIEIAGEKVWVATTSSRIYYSSDKGKTWSTQETPVVKDKPAQGIYSIDFYDENIGVAIGGDYTAPESSIANKALTKDGGRTWNLIASGSGPNYKSCIQFVPNSGGKGIVAVGFTGISYSSDMGITWKKLSDESFYTIRFLNDTTAYAAGKNRISKLVFE